MVVGICMFDRTGQRISRGNLPDRGGFLACFSGSHGPMARDQPFDEATDFVTNLTQILAVAGAERE